MPTVYPVPHGDVKTKRGPRRVRLGPHGTYRYLAGPAVIEMAAEHAAEQPAEIPPTHSFTSYHSPVVSGRHG